METPRSRALLFSRRSASFLESKSKAIGSHLMFTAGLSVVTPCY